MKTKTWMWIGIAVVIGVAGFFVGQKIAKDKAAKADK